MTNKNSSGALCLVHKMQKKQKACNNSACEFVNDVGETRREWRKNNKMTLLIKAIDDELYHMYT